MKKAIPILLAIVLLLSVSIIVPYAANADGKVSTGRTVQIAETGVSVGDTFSVSLPDYGTIVTKSKWGTTHPANVQILGGGLTSCTVKVISYTSSPVKVYCNYTFRGAGGLVSSSDYVYTFSITNSGSGGSSSGGSGYVPVETEYVTVTFNAGGGNVYPSSISVLKRETVNDFPTPTFDGYEFDGWYESPGSVSRVYSRSFLSDTTLYARWIEKSKTTISSIYIDDVSAPTSGSAPVYSAYVSSSEDYTVEDLTEGDFHNGVAWYDVESGKAMSPTDKFVGGKEYSVHIYVKPKTDCVFENDPYASVNDNYADFITTMKDDTVCVAYTFTCEGDPTDTEQSTNPTENGKGTNTGKATEATEATEAAAVSGTESATTPTNSNNNSTNSQSSTSSQKSDTTSPKTGDRTGVYLWMLVMVGAGVVIFAVRRKGFFSK